MTIAYSGLPQRIGTADAANELLRTLTANHGPLMFHQSGGCCDGSAPMCYTAGEFRVGGADVLLGELVIDGIADPIKVWISLETPEGLRFIIRSRLFTDEEWLILKDEKVHLGNGELVLVG